MKRWGFGYNPDRGSHYWDRFEFKKERKVTRKLIGVKNADLIQVVTDANGASQNDLTETVFDTTSRTDSAKILLTNSTGAERRLWLVAIKGQKVIRLQGAEGFIHDAFVDDESIEKNGEIKLGIDNDFIVTKTQVEQIADFWRKEGRTKKHFYELTLRGTQYNLELGEWYTLQLNESVMGKDEYIDSTVSVESLTIERMAGELGITTVVFKEEEANWTFDANSPARFLSSGGAARDIFPDKITVASSTFVGTADYYCDGTSDEDEINNAIIAAQAFGGGIVQLTEGQFNIDGSIDPVSNLLMEGAGANTIIEKNCNDYGIDITGSGAGSEITSIIVRNFKITRNASDTNTKSLIYAQYVQNLLLDTIHTDDSYDYGIEIRDSFDFKITTCLIENCGTDSGGIIIANASVSQTPSIINNNIIKNNDYRGLRIENSDNINVNSNICYNNGLYGILTIASERTQISDNTCYGNGSLWTEGSRHGVGIYAFTGNNHNINNNSCYDNYLRGIHIGSCNDVIVNVNNCVDNGNIILRANCENASAPIINGDGSSTSNCTWARDGTESYGLTYSYKMTKSSAAGAGDAEARLNDNDNTNDLHTLAASRIYRLTAWVYIPSTGGPQAAEVTMEFYEYYSGAWHAHTATATGQDVWEQLDSGEITLNGSATGVDLHFKIASAAAQNEFIYVDCIRLYETNIANNYNLNYFDQGTNTQTNGNSWQ